MTVLAGSSRRSLELVMPTAEVVANATVILSIPELRLGRPSMIGSSAWVTRGNPSIACDVLFLARRVGLGDVPVDLHRRRVLDFGSLGVYSGKDDLDRFIAEVVEETLESSVHTVHNPLIDVGLNRDRATGRWYAHSPVTFVAGRGAARVRLCPETGYLLQDRFEQLGMMSSEFSEPDTLATSLAPSFSSSALPSRR